MSKTLRKYLEECKNLAIKETKKRVIDTKTNSYIDVPIIKVSRVADIPKNVIDTNTFLDKNSESYSIYKVKVKSYMLDDNYNFHKTWNQGSPMPMTVMYGTILDETKTMIKMDLHCRITESDTCLRCGRRLTNDVSKLYGLGPECGEHYYINPLTLQEFANHKKAIEQNLNEIKWCGWIPKLAINSKEIIDELL